MNYEVAETEIVSKLLSNMDINNCCDVVPLPDDIANYKTPTVKGLITVVFISEKFESNQSVGQVSQHSTATFNISIQARRLRGAKGVYAISEMVKQSLLGFRPSDCGALVLGDHDFAGYQNDVWEHTLTFACRTLRNQNEAYLIPEAPITDDEVFYQKKVT